jgi:predicted ATPase/class 3 adenylate cyclase
VRTDLPTGTVTFLFTDIEGSTKLLHEVGDQPYSDLLAAHDRQLRQVWARHGGVEVDTQGDAFFVAFARASDAVAAAEGAQAAMRDGPVRIRMGLHTGEPQLRELGYAGADVHRAARIAAAGHGGQVLLSRTTRDLVAVAVRDLGEHRLKDLSAPERIFQLGGEEFPRLNTLRQTNLPVQPNPLVARGRELAEVTAFVRGGTRLVTLTGAGGSGKTRLALHVAAELAEDYRDGVWFVPLAAVFDPALVEPAIAEVAGVEYGSKDLLLVLDNLEQLLPDVATVVAALPVQMLVTSRERLAVSAEQAYEVPPLPVDDAESLFVERARRLVPGFEPDEHVREIVRRVDGLPLAVELAAARVMVLPPQQILERLGRSLDLLTGGTRDAPARQRTLRATIEWSHELLDEAERALFTRLGVFAGTFDAESAEEVAGASIDELAALVDKSLIRVTRDGRFFLLETVREFAAELLVTSGEGEELRQGLLEQLLGVLPLRQAAGTSDEFIARRRRFVAELPNTRLILNWLLESARYADLLELVRRCGGGWEESGAHEESYRWGEAALEGDVASPARWDVLMITALHAGVTGRVDRAIELGEEAVAYARTDAPPDGYARSVGALAETYGRARRFDDARVWWEEALRVSPRGSQAEVSNLHNYGEIELQAGNLTVAADLLGRALEASRAFPGSGHASGILHGLGDVALTAGDLEGAAAKYRDALAEARGIGMTAKMLAHCVGGLAAVAAATGADERAAMLWGILQRTEATYTPMLAFEREPYERRLGALDPDLVERGGALDEDAALDYALSVD